MNKITVNSNEYDFGNIMISALRYALTRKTYVSLETAEFIMNNEKYISERVCKVMLRDINRYLNLFENGFDTFDKCDYDTWVKLDNWLYSIAKKNNWLIIER